MAAEIRIKEHPRAVAQIRRAKGWGGLLGFGLVALLSMQAGTDTASLLMRSLVGGIIGYVLLWALAVIVWRQLAVAELSAATKRAIAYREQQAAKTREAAEAGRGGGPAPDETMVIR